MSEEKDLNNKKSDLASAEEVVLDFWQKNQIFKKSTEKKSPSGEFVFYEGPPTANGKPGIHHLEARAFKDIIPRYKTMKGFNVRRKGGWDTHGLPVELQVEKQLGLKSKKEIEDYGVEKFNQKCRESVWEYLDLWNNFTDRIGYWVDRDNPYITYDNSYIESVWNILKTVDGKNLLYKDYKVLPWCPRCGTALSSHELAQGYEEVKDLSVYVKFKVKNQEDTFILAWTTTPWTLPGNVGLAVNPNITYVEVEVKNISTELDQKFILAKSRLESVVGNENFKIIREMSGEELVGLEYEPLYHYLSNKFQDKNPDGFNKAYKIYSADFVNIEDGTGVVHIAPMYGQDDFELGTKNNLPKFHLVNEAGVFVDGCDFLSGKFVKDEGVVVDIIKDLAHKDLLFKKEKYTHTYPHCWRCHTPLIYYARDSWYIKMSSLRGELLEANKDINWEPSHIREGRFGEWLKEVKDWAISRERYWGTPLPIWQNSEGQITVIGSIDELKQKTKKSGNTYTVMRHGEAESNVAGIMNSDNSFQSNLTPEGIKQIEQAIDELKSKNIDLIISSPLTRTTETASLVKEALGVSELIFDERLKEVDFGQFNGSLPTDYHSFFNTSEDYFTKTPLGGENLSDVKKRLGDFIYDLETRYSNTNILIVSHRYPLWLLLGLIEGSDRDKFIASKESWLLKTAEVRNLPFVSLPHNSEYELDLHKPYIDNIFLQDEQGQIMTRVKEVADVWLDSGAMPFAQDHWPFSKEEFLYPADYISEGIDQTRGWFYTLHAVGILLGKGKAYKNVISLGLILDSQGKKMSKSVGNVIEPQTVIDKYGVDALRLWMYSVNQPGDFKNFDERTVDEIVKKVFNLINNIKTFYDLYKGESEDGEITNNNILDAWILTRLNQMVESGTKYLDDYKILEASRLIRDFVNDFSTWYIRRSRDRFKEDDSDKKAALATTRFVLLELAKYMAPFTPFFAENLYQDLRKSEDPISVHLCDWPDASNQADEQILELMDKVRHLVSLGLEQRSSGGVKVRQILSQVSIKDNLGEEYLGLIKDELNVKDVVINNNQEADLLLDLKLTPELKTEGYVRELIRFIQNMRKEKNLLPSDRVDIIIEANDLGVEIVQNNLAEIIKIVGANSLILGKTESGDTLTVDDLEFKVVF